MRRRDRGRRTEPPDTSRARGALPGWPSALLLHIAVRLRVHRWWGFGFGAGVASPGTPGWTAFLGGLPIGGGPLGFWELIHVLKAVGETTFTVERMSEWPAPPSSVHSAG